MVGVGIDGIESSLARVSLVNFYGAIQLDEFVRQRERVVDYRTQFSGIRAADMIKGMHHSSHPGIANKLRIAKPFEEIQKQVADLLKDRILIGHAVYNDLKVRSIKQYMHCVSWFDCSRFRPSSCPTRGHKRGILSTMLGNLRCRGADTWRCEISLSRS